MKAQPEPYLATVHELAPLYDAHWREMALHQDTCPLNPRWDIYEAMARSGVLQLVTLRDDDQRLVGYWLGFVDRHLHYEGNVVASTDIFRVLPEVRGRHGGVKLFRAVARHVKSLGADRLIGCQQTALRQRKIVQGAWVSARRNRPLFGSEGPFIMGIAAAVGAAAAVASAGVGIAGAVGGSKAQSSDVSTGQAQANAAEQQAYSDYSADASPYISTGTNALSSLGDAAGLNGATGYQNALSSFDASPGYQYDLSQGLSAIDNGAAQTGTLRSGNTIRAEETLGSNLANQDFSNYYNRLSGLATSGLTATNALGQAGLSSAGAVASTDTSAATSQANIAGNTAKGVGSALTGLAGNSSVQNALSGLGSTGTSTPYNLATDTGVLSV